MKLIRRLLVLAVITCALIVPATASAQVDDSYQGWGTVTAASGNYWAPAYQWYDSYGWWNTYRYTGASVWVQPYATGWSWTWTGGRGWLAMRIRDLSGPAGTLATGATGRLTAGPSCPVEPCAGPGPTVTLTFAWAPDRNNTQPQTLQKRVTVVSGSGYRVALGPGVYSVTANYGINFRRYVTVPASGFVTADFDIDSGIR